MSQVATDTYDLSFQGLVLGFMKFAFDRGETSFPSFKSSSWHDFLYLLKNNFQDKFPELECVGKFDWVIISPKSVALKDATSKLMNNCSPKTVSGGRIVLKQETKTNAKNPLEKYYPELAEKMLVFAHEIPGFFNPA